MNYFMTLTFSVIFSCNKRAHVRILQKFFQDSKYNFQLSSSKIKICEKRRLIMNGSSLFKKCIKYYNSLQSSIMNVADITKR